MKKIGTFALSLLFLLCTGCNLGEKEVTCTNQLAIDEDTNLKSTYEITYKGEFVTKLKTIEKVEASDNEKLQTYRDSLEEVYSKYKDIKYYTNVLTIEKNTLISTTVIDYQKVDTNKLIKADSSNSSLIEGGKVKLSTLKEVYEESGAICKK